jgi:hypothetical protein
MQVKVAGPSFPIWRQESSPKGSKNPVRYIRTMHAFFPVKVREALRDSLTEAGITEEDLRELVKKFPTGKQ